VVAGALITGVTLVLYIPWFDFPKAFEPLLVAARGEHGCTPTGRPTWPMAPVRSSMRADWI
jgi:hypothetical protein